MPEIECIQFYFDLAVNLGSACIISQPLEINSETLRPGNSRNFLVVGARLSFQFEQEVSKDSSMTEMGLADNKSTDVMVQNRLNQEKNGECAISAAEFGGICAKEMPSETRLVKRFADSAFEMLF